MLPVQITFKDIPVSSALETHIRKKAEKLSQFCHRINSCRVVIDMAQKNKHQGKLFHVRIDVKVPRKEFAVTKKYDQDVYVVIRDAFAAIERQLEEHSRKINGQVKRHDGVMHGHIKRLISDEGYGFIQGIDGNEYYFSLTNVSYPSFKKLMIGDAVEYLAQAQGDGWLAHHVVKERHNHYSEKAA